MGACRSAFGALGAGLEAGDNCCRYKEEGLEGGPPKWSCFDTKKKKLIKSSSSERTNQFVQFIARTTGLINPIPVQPISGLIDWPDRLVQTGF